MRHSRSILALALSLGCQTAPSVEPEQGVAGAGTTNAATRPKAPKANATFELPDDPDAVVITYDWDRGSEAMLYYVPNSPKLQVFASGRVIVRDPYGSQTVADPTPGHVPMIEGTIPVMRVGELATFIAAPVFLDADSDAVREATFEAHGEIADGGSVSVKLEGKRASHAFYAYALSTYQEAGGFPVLDHMAEVDRRLSALSVEVSSRHPSAP